MTVDSEDKRRDIGGVPPVPDGTIDAEDRRHIAGIPRTPGAAAPATWSASNLTATLSVSSILTATLGVA